MGLTLTDHIYSLDIPYSGFYRLRCDIACMMSDDIGAYYGKMPEALAGDERSKRSWEDGINKALNDYLDEQKSYMSRVADFLFLPDCEGSITYGACRHIADLIDKNGGVDFMDRIYGYAGWGGKACRGRDIYRLLKECATLKKRLVWY